MVRHLTAVERLHNTRCSNVNHPLVRYAAATPVADDVISPLSFVPGFELVAWLVTPSYDKATLEYGCSRVPTTRLTLADAPAALCSIWAWAACWADW